MEEGGIREGEGAAAEVKVSHLSHTLSMGGDEDLTLPV